MWASFSAECSLQGWPLGPPLCPLMRQCHLACVRMWPVSECGHFTLIVSLGHLAENSGLLAKDTMFYINMCVHHAFNPCSKGPSKRPSVLHFFCVKDPFVPEWFEPMTLSLNTVFRCMQQYTEFYQETGLPLQKAGLITEGSVQENLGTLTLVKLGIWRPTPMQGSHQACCLPGIC